MSFLNMVTAWMETASAHDLNAVEKAAKTFLLRRKRDEDIVNCLGDLVIRIGKAVAEEDAKPKRLKSKKVLVSLLPENRKPPSIEVGDVVKLPGVTAMLKACADAYGVRVDLVTWKGVVTSGENLNGHRSVQVELEWLA